MTAQIHSMTGYAGLSGQAEGVSWDWDVRSVNSRGLDVRMRLADGFEALEPKLRAALAGAITRGSVSVALKLGQRSYALDVSLNVAGLAAAIKMLDEAHKSAKAKGVKLRKTSAAELLQMRGVVEQGAGLAISETVLAAAEAQIALLVDALTAMRRAEGAALNKVLLGQVETIADLTAKARISAEARAANAGDLLAARVSALLDSGSAEPDRLAQELALLAVKTDITEEIDRLNAHVAAARDLIAAGGPVGRKLDFLMQEFNREANTLCSKAQSTALTSIGLEMKLVIDQMREQVQNLE